MTSPISFVDTETTDVGPRRLAWELAVIRRDPDGTRRELQTFIEVDLADANPYALRVGRFHERHPLGRFLAGLDDLGNGIKAYADGTPIPQGFPDGSTVGGFVEPSTALALWCRWTHGAHIVGAVPSFDVEVMAAMAREARLLPSHDHHLSCISDLIAGWLRGQGKPMPGEWRFDAFAEAAGLPPVPDDVRHTALGDAQAVERAYDLVMGGTDA